MYVVYIKDLIHHLLNKSKMSIFVYNIKDVYTIEHVKTLNKRRVETNIPMKINDSTN